MKKYVAYITSIIRQVFWFCLPWIVGFYILDILEINTLSAKQILFIYMLWVIHPMVKNFILGIKSRKNYTNFSFNDGFHDAIANELMRIQFKLNQLVNNTYPCFETPKEMRNHPMTMMDFRMFVEYWQAYSAYPEIAACELLEGHEDTHIPCIY